MYAVVADVNRYHEFIPWCLESRILSTTTPHKPLTNPKQATNPHQQSPARLIEHQARLVVGFGALKEQYTSKVIRQEHWPVPDRWSVRAIASDSELFDILETDWVISRSTTDNNSTLISQRRCLVDFSIQFRFRSVLHSQLSSTFFSQVCRVMVKAFEERAVYLIKNR
jgi:coenzyme Q-binding protein COQ10